jgi:hypothetical protein
MLFSFSSTFEKLHSWEWEHKFENPATLKFRWGVHKDQDGKKTVCMCECSIGIFFFMFDSIGSSQQPVQFVHWCDSPISDYGSTYYSKNPYLATTSTEEYPETCDFWCIKNNDTAYETCYQKSGIHISAIAFLPAMSKGSTWFAIGTKAGNIMILAFSGAETPVCKYTFSQQSFGAVSVICSCPEAFQTKSMHSGQWRNQNKTRYYCAKDDDQCEDGKYSVCMHKEDRILDDHWSCCGSKMRSNLKCENADPFHISFATCFPSGI